MADTVDDLEREFYGSDDPSLTLNDLRYEYYKNNTASGSGGSVSSKVFVDGAQLSSIFSRKATASNVPTVTWESGSTTKMTSPVEYIPYICGTGSKVEGSDGQDDPNIIFHPGSFATNNGANSDKSMIGEAKPGASLAYSWPVIAEFDTSSGVDTIEIGFYGSNPVGLMVDVNGTPAFGSGRELSSITAAGGSTATLEFPSPGSRRIRFYIPPAAGLAAIRVNTGETISKPITSTRTGVILGDSYVNGAGSENSFPVGTSWNTTYALNLLKSLGCNRLVFAGVGGSGMVAGPSPYSDRVPWIVNLNPEVLVITGSVNDAADDITSSLSNILDATSSIAERYVIGVSKGSESNHTASEVVCSSKNVTFIPMLNFFNGTGTVVNPAGDGNSDLFIMADAIHPSLTGHMYMSAHLTGVVNSLRG